MTRSIDWLLTSSLLILIGALFVIAKTQSIRMGCLSPKAPVFVDVAIDGHVSKPGVYSSEVGTPICEVVKKAKPKSFAKKCEGRVVEPCSIHVEKLTELVVFVNDEELIVPVGTRVCDLKKYISLRPDEFPKTRRLLKNEEKIKIPLDKKKL
jgi:hypothetical protein